MLIKNNTEKVMKLFFENPEKKFHIREIARIVKISSGGAFNIIKKLKKTGLLSSEKKGVIENVSASKTEKFIQLKRCYNLYSIFSSGLVQFLRDKYEEPEAIILFGSYGKGEDISESDIDIAIITKKHIKIDLKKFDDLLKRKINTYEIQISECKKEFINNLVNGIILYGYLKVV